MHTKPQPLPLSLPVMPAHTSAVSQATCQVGAQARSDPIFPTACSGSWAHLSQETQGKTQRRGAPCQTLSLASRPLGGRPLLNQGELKGLATATPPALSLEAEPPPPQSMATSSRPKVPRKGRQARCSGLLRAPWLGQAFTQGLIPNPGTLLLESETQSLCHSLRPAQPWPPPRRCEPRSTQVRRRAAL